MESSSYLRRIPWLIAALFFLFSSQLAAQSVPEQTCDDPNVDATTPSSDFEIILDGAIARHRRTGLEWRRCVEGYFWNGDDCVGDLVGYDWQQALEIASDNTWRVPSIVELRTLVEHCNDSPAINRRVFPRAPAEVYWSSTPWRAESGRARAVLFTSGLDGNLEMTELAVVRLVRDP